MSGLAFEEIVRNLLVYLKGQIPSMNSKNTQEEVVRQLQTISFTLRTTIVQLEGAAFRDPKGTEEYHKLKEELESLKATNSRLEETLFLEMNKTKDFSEQLKAMEGLEQQKDDIIAQLQSNNVDTEKDIKISKLIEENNELRNRPAEAVIDDNMLLKLKDEVDSLENKIVQDEEQISSLKQALQDKDIELSKTKEDVINAMKLDKNEIVQLKQQLTHREDQQAEIDNLRKEVETLTANLELSPSKEIFHNNMAASEAKISFLTKNLNELKAQKDLVSTKELNMLKTEKNELEKRVIDLEATLRNTIKSRENTSETTFKTEESVLLFDTLYSTMKRLNQSPENKDIYQKAKDGLEILEKSHAISKIPTLAQKYDAQKHHAVKSYKCDFLDDGLIISESSPGFASGSHVIQKAMVFVNKSSFICEECSFHCRGRDLFCPKCGLELAAPDGTTKKDLQSIPTTVEFNLPLIDALIKQQEFTAANALTAAVAREHPDNNDIVKRQQNLVLRNNSTNVLQYDDKFM